MAGPRWTPALFALTLFVSAAPAQGIVISGGFFGHSHGYGSRSAFSLGTGFGYYGFSPYRSAYGRSRLTVVYAGSQTVVVPVPVPSSVGLGPDDGAIDMPPRRIPERRTVPDELPPPAPVAPAPVPGQNAGVFHPLGDDARERARQPVVPEPPPAEPARPEFSAPPAPAEASPIDRGRAAFAAGEYGRAADFFRRALAENANDPQASFFLVQALIALGKYTAAADAARAAVEHFPGWPALAIRPVDLYGPNAAEYRNHLRLLGETQAVHADDPVLSFLYGYALWFDGRKDEARALFRRAAPAYPAAERFLRPVPAVL
jgi:hypothetical protein